MFEKHLQERYKMALSKMESYQFKLRNVESQIKGDRSVN
jgi:hypothetical protein